MQTVFSASDFFDARSERMVFDVRSPGEYAQGHIPGAISFPLFSDEERAVVGTAYKQESRELALELGLEFVGPKMAGFVRQAKKLAPDRRIAVHCWRGGQRSGSMAWLLRQADFDVVTLEGGYKAYRQWVLEAFEKNIFRLFVLGGGTGSGKTKVLWALQDQGEQIIDLERIANHKGSAFGFIGEMPQPTVEQFENNFHDALYQLDPSRQIWVENESRSIGRVSVPAGFWQQMKNAPLFNIEIPEPVRIQNLVDDYVGSDRADLETAFLKIDKKLGGQHLKAALQALQEEDFPTAAAIALRYYDKTYQHGLETSSSPDIRHLTFDHGDPAQIATILVGRI